VSDAHVSLGFPAGLDGKDPSSPVLTYDSVAHNLGSWPHQPYHDLTRLPNLMVLLQALPQVGVRAWCLLCGSTLTKA
jgi:hypothetical protein